MESVAALRSFYSIGTVLNPNVRSSHKKPSIVHAKDARRIFSHKSYFHGLTNGASSPVFPQRYIRYRMQISRAKASETTETAKSDVFLGGSPQEAIEKKTSRSATFPSALEALVLDVCNDTEVAQLKLKVGDFEKRNVGATASTVSSISPSPIPIEPMVKSVPDTPPPLPPKSSAGKLSPFVNVSADKSSKLAALEASGATGFVLVSSPIVGLFQMGRKVKGKRLPPSYNVGDFIKQGQAVGYVDQFGSELPVKKPLVMGTQLLQSCHPSKVPPTFRLTRATVLLMILKDVRFVSISDVVLHKNVQESVHWTSTINTSRNIRV